MRQLHVLTPGDHFSPRTGSAVATVVNGLASHTSPRPGVLLAQGTYADRYDTCDPIEYHLSITPHGASRRTRGVDALLGRLGLPRPWARMVHRQVLVDQEAWPASFVIGHNSPQLVPLVSDRHAPVLYAHNDLLDWYSAREAGRVLGRVHRIIGVSEYTAEHLAEKLPPPLRARLRVVPNGVEASRFEGLRTPRVAALRVGFVGRVIPRKGVHVLMQAVTQLARNDIELTVVGSSGFAADAPLTAYETRLRKDAKRIPGVVRFLPFQARTEIPDLLGTFDVTVVPSVESEASALTVLEGMAAGSAVVASEVGGVPETAGGAALLVPPGDSKALAAALEALADSEGVLASVAERGVARAREMSWRRSADLLACALR